MKVLVLLLYLHFIALVVSQSSSVNILDCNELCTNTSSVRAPNPNFVFPQTNLTCPTPPWVTFPTTNNDNITFNFNNPNYLNFIDMFDFDACCVQHELCYLNCFTTKEFCENLFFQCLTAFCTEFTNLFGTQGANCQELADCWASAYVEPAFSCNMWETLQSEACICVTGQPSPSPSPIPPIQGPFTDPSGPLLSSSNPSGPWPNNEDTRGDNSGPIFVNNQINILGNIPAYSTLTCPDPLWFEALGSTSASSHLYSFLSNLL